MTAVDTQGEVSVDAFLGGRVEAIQPMRGHHRSGLEAILLAAALPARISGEIVDLGSGVGVAGLCAAARCRDASIVLVERDTNLLALAESALRRPANRAIAERVRVAAVDIGAPETDRIAAGVPRDRAAAVLTNPPFYRAGSVRVSPSSGRAGAHVLDEGLEPWFRAAASALAPGGTLVVILPPLALPEALAVMRDRFGSITILPVHPRPNVAAHRMLIAARKGARGPLSILSGLELHGPAGEAFTADVEAVLRGTADLAAIHAGWDGALA